MNLGKSCMRGAHHVSGWGEINYKYVYTYKGGAVVAAMKWLNG